MSRKTFVVVWCSVIAVVAFAPQVATAQREPIGNRRVPNGAGWGGNVGSIIGDVGGIIGRIEQGMDNGGNGGNYSNGYPSNNYDDDDGGNYYPPRNSYANPYPNSMPAPNAAPAKPRPNALPKPIKPVKNVVKGLQLGQVTRDAIQQWHDQATQKIDQDIFALKNSLPGDGTQTVMLNNSGLPPADINKAKSLIAQGDTAGLKQLFQNDNVPAANADPLLNIAGANAALNQLQADANQGSVTNADITSVFNALSPFVGPAGAQQADAALSDIAATSLLVGALNLAVPGNNPLPAIASMIFLVPGLAQGLTFPLGNGAVIAGGNMPGNVGITVSQGPVAQAAGLSVGAGQPLPPAGGSAGPANGVLLTNAASLPVNYTVNDQHFMLQPGYKQALPDGNAWTVAFDKGGSAGAARYSLSTGTYSFTADADGWELYKKTYKATLDNSKNSQDFNFMLDGKQQTLAAGATQDLSSDYPIAVTFDNGTGQAVTRRLESGAVQVALAPDGQSIDLFAAASDDPPAGASPAGGAVQAADALPGRLNLFSKAAVASSGGVQLFGSRQTASAIQAAGGGAN